MNENQSENFAYIDGQNLHSGVSALGWKMDHKKFRDFLSTKYKVTKAYYFVGFMEEHQDLYSALQEAGFILVFKPLVRYDDGTIKGNVDADMVLQCMIDVGKFKKAVLVTGDGDFAGLIRHLASVRKLEKVLIPNKNNYSSLFDRQEGFDKFGAHVNDFKGQLAYRFNNKPKRAQPGSKPKNGARGPSPKT